MRSLVLACVVAQVRSGAFTGDSPFRYSRDCGSVVAAVKQGGVLRVGGVTDKGYLSEQGGMFQVAVGHLSVGVIHGHEPFLHAFRKGETPDVWLVLSIVVYPTHAGFGGIRGTDVGGQLGDDFSQVSGSRREASR